jgi:hypothetical protein
MAKIPKRVGDVQCVYLRIGFQPVEVAFRISGDLTNLGLGGPGNADFTRSVHQPKEIVGSFCEEGGKDVCRRGDGLDRFLVESFDWLVDVI